MSHTLCTGQEDWPLIIDVQPLTFFLLSQILYQWGVSYSQILWGALYLQVMYTIITFSIINNRRCTISSGKYEAGRKFSTDWPTYHTTNVTHRSSLPELKNKQWVTSSKVRPLWGTSDGIIGAYLLEIFFLYKVT